VTIVKRVLLEAMAVGAAGVVFAFLANFVSPRGLALGRDVFHGETRPLPVRPASNGVTSVSSANSNALSSVQIVLARLKQKGLQVADSNQVIHLFRDPRYEQELCIIVDSRDDRHFEEGHVPGAYHFDHYHPADYLAPVLSACQTAEQVLVYCNGGTCEDSEFAALSLRDAGVPVEKLFVYVGGFAEWLTNGLPVEIGARKSGVLREAQK
jgi:rhodanese-related sulfurtransferase